MNWRTSFGQSIHSCAAEENPVFLMEVRPPCGVVFSQRPDWERKIADLTTSAQRFACEKNQSAYHCVSDKQRASTSREICYLPGTPKLLLHVSETYHMLRGMHILCLVCVRENLAPADRSPCSRRPIASKPLSTNNSSNGRREGGRRRAIRRGIRRRA